MGGGPRPSTLLKAALGVGLVWDLRLPSESVKFSFRKYSPEDQVAVESMPAMFGSSRLAALTTRARVAEAVKGATELAGPAPLPALGAASTGPSTMSRAARRLGLPGRPPAC